MTLRLELFTIYHDTSDYPGKYVARRWVVYHAGDPIPDREPTCVADTLDACRAGIHPQLRSLFARLERSPGDDGQIIETWI